MAEDRNASPAENEVEEVSRAFSARVPLSEILERQRAGWLDRHRGAIVKSKKQIGHRIVEKAYGRTFEKMSQYLFFISVFARAIIRSEEDVMQVEKSVHNTLQNGIKAIDRLTRESEALFQAKSIDKPETWNSAKEIEFPLTSPMSRLYAQLLESADQFLLYNTVLWINGGLHDKYELNERTRTDNEMAVKRVINTVAYGILTHYRRVLKFARKQQADAGIDSGIATEVETVVETPAKGRRANAKPAAASEVAAAA